MISDLTRHDNQHAVCCVLIKRVIISIRINGSDIHNLILYLLDIMAELFVYYVYYPIVFW